MGRDAAQKDDKSRARTAASAFVDGDWKIKELGKMKTAKD